MSYRVSPIDTKACGVTSSTTQSPTSASWYAHLIEFSVQKMPDRPAEKSSLAWKSGRKGRVAWERYRKELERVWERQEFLGKSSYLNPFASSREQLKQSFRHQGLLPIAEHSQKSHWHRIIHSAKGGQR